MLFFCLFCSQQLQAFVPPADTIPFEIRADHRIYVTVCLNGDTSSPLTFLFDTGATDIVLNASLPEVLQKAKFTETISNHGATSTEVIPATRPDQRLQMGRSSVDSLRFIATPYPPTAWDGVLGLSFMKHFDVAINYDRKEIYLYPLGGAPKEKHPGWTFTYRAGVPILEVEVTINKKQYPLQVELDSGSDRVLDINTPFVHAHQLRGTLPVFAISTISGTSNQQGRLENVCFDEVRIGDTVFPLLPGAFSTLTQGLQATAEWDGVIGNQLLQRFNQIWDFANRRVYLTVNHRFYTPFYDFLIAR